jgi:hypothetical protein
MAFNLEQFKASIAAARQRDAQLEARQQLLVEDLKTKYEVDSLEGAEELLAEETRLLREETETRDGLLAKFREKYPDLV